MSGQRIIRARPGRIASTTPSRTRTVARDAANPLESPSDDPGRSSPSSSAHRRPSVDTPRAGPPTAYRLISSPTSPSIDRSSRTTAICASPSTASISHGRPPIGPEQEGVPQQVVEPAAVAADHHDPTRLGGDGRLHRKLQVGCVLVDRVAFHARRAGDRVGRSRVEVPDEEVDPKTEPLGLDDPAVGGDHEGVLGDLGQRGARGTSRTDDDRGSGIASSASITWVRFAGRRRDSRPLSPVARAPRWNSSSIGRVRSWPVVYRFGAKMVPWMMWRAPA